MDNYNKNLVLVDENDKIIGTMKALKAHKLGSLSLHRAFSVFIFHNSKLLIHKRAKSKLTFPSLWTNTCCSHPFINKNSFTSPVEDCKYFAIKRLKYEMGIDLEMKDLKFVCRILYKADGKTYDGRLLNNDVVISDFVDYTIGDDEEFVSNDNFGEYEIDYVFFVDKLVQFNLNASEVEDCKWVDKNEWSSMIKRNETTPWTSILYEIMMYLMKILKLIKFSVLFN